jgi:hypothetical protein
MEYLTGTVGRYSLIPTGAYLMLNDGTFLYPSAPDYSIDNVTENVMYKEAMKYTNSWFYYYDVPYFDSVTGGLCASVLRHVHLKDGREGCFAADLFLASASDKLDKVQSTASLIRIKDDGTTEEVYGFDIPVPAIGEEFDLANIGTKGKWYDHKVSVQNPVPQN